MVDVEKINREKTIKRAKTLENRQKSIEFGDLHSMMQKGGMLGKGENADELFDPENIEE